jgi:diguanylate cyclase (GGDEF)-like protein/PAS domain S-box-containing protein
MGGEATDALSCKNTVPLDAAVAADIFQRLAGAATIPALFDAMCAAAHVHAHVERAYVIDDRHHTTDGAALPPPGTVLVSDRDGGQMVTVALPAGTGMQSCWLCAHTAAAYGQPRVDVLTLIGHCGATMRDKLGDERSLLRTLIDNMPDQIYVKDTEGRFILGNTAAASCIGVASPDDLVGKSDLELFPGECGQRFFRDEQTLMQSGRAIVDQLEENINQAGVRRWFSTTKVPLQDEAGKVIGLVGMSRDVSLRVAADEEIRLRNRAIESSLDAIVITSCLLPGNPVVYVNPAFERITGFSFDEATQGGIERLIAHDGDAAAPELLLAIRDHAEGRAVLQSRRKDNATFWNEVRIAPVCDMSGRATHFVLTMTDITKARDIEEKLERMASQDALTGLPNRRMLMDRLGQAVALGERGNFVVAVAFIDLDRLKFVNDSLGHEAGDTMLRTVAERMASCVGKSDTVARLGGDEFVLISLHGTTHASSQDYRHIRDMLAKLQGVLAEPMLLAGEPHSVTCSIGVSIFPQHGDNADSLLKNADAAMYQAKKNGRNQIAFHGGGPAENS